MIDILRVAEGGDLIMLDTQLKKAENILSIQLGALEYAKSFGIDLKYFLNESYSFENESFKAYLIERLADSAINVTDVSDLVESLFSTYIFSIGDDQTQNGLMAR